MEYPNNEPNDISPVDSKLSVWEKIKGPLGKIILVLIVLVVLFLLFLFAKTASDKDNQKLSQKFKHDLVDKGSMSDSILLPEVVEIANEVDKTVLIPEEKVTPDDGNTPAVAPQEDNPEEKIAENNSKAVPAVKNETAKKTTTVKMPTPTPVKEKSKAISCKHKNDHPSYSKTKGKHMDEDCCPDPDEWPKPGCVYSQKGLDLMLSGPPKKKK